MTTLLIVDDQELVRVGLRKILDGEQDMTVSVRPVTARKGSPRLPGCDRMWC
jgi:DNA-binding NarL/FixJ family response regulator